MNTYLQTKIPTIYADMNIFRYLSYGDISIVEPERFLWVYSHAHLDEIHRNGNTDALEGMKLLHAVEITDVLNEEFQSVGNIMLHEYTDPYERYEKHLEAVSGYEEVTNHMIEHLIRYCGADNFKELSKTPEQLKEEIERLTSVLDDMVRENILKKADEVSQEMKNSINTHLRSRTPIDETRRAFGLTSEKRKNVEKSKSPIDDVWELISPALANITKDQFFGFEPVPGIESSQHTQHGAISGSHIVLNMIGISPDKGLSNREKIKNIISDGQHIGMASYCNALLSADRALSNKARCIYSYLGNITKVLYFEYIKGYVLNLEINEG